MRVWTWPNQFGDSLATVRSRHLTQLLDMSTIWRTSRWEKLRSAHEFRIDVGSAMVRQFYHNSPGKLMRKSQTLIMNKALTERNEEYSGCLRTSWTAIALLEFRKTCCSSGSKLDSRANRCSSSFATLQTSRHRQRIGVRTARSQGQFKDRATAASERENVSSRAISPLDIR